MATRAELRKSIAYDLNDVLEVTVTANAGNSTTRLYAVGQINAGAETNIGRELICRTADTNLGEIRRVLATNPREGWIDLDRAVNEAFATNDQVELYGFRGRGWRVVHYHHNIDRAIAEAFPAHKGTRTEEVIAAAFDADSPSVAVPATLNYVAQVEYLLPGQTRYSIVPMAEDRLYRGWSVDEPNEAIVIRGDDWLGALDGATIKLIGYTRAGPMTAETSTTTVPSEWIIDRAKELMLMSGTDRDAARYNMAMVSREDSNTRSRLALRTRGLGARAKWIRD